MKQKRDQEFHHKRSLGQNFITDDALFAQLVDLAGVGENDAVLEIGAGDRKSTRLNSSHPTTSRMPSSA